MKDGTKTMCTVEMPAAGARFVWLPRLASSYVEDTASCVHMSTRSGAGRHQEYAGRSFR